VTQPADELERAIHDIHDFFTDWIGGRCPGDEATFRANALDRLSDDLVAIFPGGGTFGKSDLAGYMIGLYGSNPAFRIRIRDIRVSHQSADLAVINYHEWQRGAKDSDEPNNGRVTTMVMRRRDPKRGPEILQVHETWLPPGVQQAGDYSF